MASTNFKTENNTYRKLLGNGLSYRIPRFQRDYSWTMEEWEDLWADIEEITGGAGETAHYMGYLVLQSKDEKTFDVIDGQQRLTTISIVVLAALRVLGKLVRDGINAERNKRRMDQLRQSYIGYLDPVTLVPRSKLTLNRNNDNYYQSYLVPLRELPSRGFRASEHAMRKASDWFERRIQEFSRNNGEGDEDSGVKIAQLIEDISDKLFFTVITVTDELNAYKVFETLNSRGVRLSATDLLKNYLFSVLHRDGQHEHDLEAMDARWESFVGRLGEENFPDYLRVHWITRHALVRQSDLFKTIRAQVPDRAAVFRLLNGLDEDMDSYLSLISPETSGWTGETKIAASRLRMFSVRQQFSVLIAARKILNDGDFATLIKAIVVIAFRYNVIGRQQASEQERVYSSVAQRISRGDVVNLQAILEGLRPIYLTDRAFSAAFSEMEITTRQTRNRRIVRYILTKLERNASGNEHDLDAETFNIEHILPQAPGDGWPFSDPEAQASIYRLGNMTLLNAGANRDLDNTSYEAKKPVYLDSDFEITSQIPEAHPVWTIEQLALRQAAMARVATGIWRLAQFD
ncbi:DUF262 domain-containing protein [Sphingomonas sp. LT1P40]|uniref:DUF262 domain-containing protein n=1 Tax=Alteristakelama amylovorans TaxID=3096166 RepID=UPI002FCA5217